MIAICGRRDQNTSLLAGMKETQCVEQLDINLPYFIEFQYECYCTPKIMSHLNFAWI